MSWPTLDERMEESRLWWRKKSAERGALLRYRLAKGTTWEELEVWVNALSTMRKKAMRIYSSRSFKPFCIPVDGLFKEYEENLILFTLEEIRQRHRPKSVYEWLREPAL
jgi:hypothetical protein